MACEFQNECDENSAKSNGCLCSPEEGRNATMKIWRTKSLDDAHPSFQSGRDTSVSVTEAAESTRSLHSSFDAALLLDSKSSRGKLFDYSQITGQRGSVIQAVPVRKEFSGKKHMRQKFQMNVAEGSLMETFRKQARTSVKNISCLKPSKESNFQCLTSTLKDCSSVSKRRRIPSQTNSSLHKFDTTIGNPHVKAVYERSLARELSLSPKRLTKKSWNLTPSNHREVTSAIPSYPATTSKVHSTGSKTVTTAALETTAESESCKLSSCSPEPFQFTSFPDSLPRLNNAVERHYPETICRRMSFGGEKSGINVSSQSRGEDGTQNTSISSLSAEGCRHSPIETVSFSKDLLKVISHPSSGMLEPSATSVRYPGLGKRICLSDNYSPGSCVGGTRLDFNVHLSPTQMIGDSPQTSFVQSPRNSREIQMNHFSLARASSPSPPRKCRSASSFNDSEAPLTPDPSLAKPLPTTPRDVLLHFPSEAECSPIPSSEHQGQRVHRSHSAPHAEVSSTFSTSAIFAKASRSGIADKGPEHMEKDLSFSSATAKQTQMRPMPDMSAFENTSASSRGDRSTDDSLIMDSKGLQTLPRRLCPPTPVRTPAWANDIGTFTSGRQNSLKSTKVLLACPLHILEGRNSLENSLLEEDCNRGSTDSLPDIAERNFSLVHKPDETATFISQDKNEMKRISSETHNKSLPTVGKDTSIPELSKGNGLVSFCKDFEVLSSLGSGAFADAYKVRSLTNNRLYAVKRNRRQFRGIRDRNMALAEVQYMQRLQDIVTANDQTVSQNSGKNTYSLYLLFFYRAWQEDGYFFSQTELCCRDSCKELLDSIRLRWKSSSDKYPSLSRHISPPSNFLAGINESCLLAHLPHNTVWKICHDIAAGLSHIHSHGLVHHDIKPSNILFVRNPRLGAICKICDFGLAGEIGSSSDGQEGDTRYMPSELLSSMARQPSADIFSLGLTLYEIASDHHIELPSEGPLWHQLRSNSMPQLPEFRGMPFCKLIEEMTSPSAQSRPTADDILSLDGVSSHDHRFDEFLQDYIVDVEKYDSLEEERFAAGNEEQTPRNWSGRPRAIQSPSLSMLLSSEHNLLSPTGQ